MEPLLQPTSRNVATVPITTYFALLKTMKSTKPVDIDWVISQWESLAHFLPVAHPDYEPVLASYAVTLLLRWESNHQMEDIQKVIASLERTLNILPRSPSKRRYQNLVNLGAAYLGRYEVFGTNISDITQAIGCWEQAYNLTASLSCSCESVNVVLNSLGEAYFLAYEVGQAGIDVVDRAVQCFKRVLKSDAPDKRGASMYRIGKCHSTLYVKNMKISDLEAAIINLEAATRHELDSEERQFAIVELTRMLSKKYDRTGALSDLHNAIRWARVAVEGDQDNSLTVRNLADLLYRMYKTTRSPKMLDELILNYEAIWNLHEKRPTKNAASFHYRFGTAYIWRFHEAGDQGRLQDIEKAVELLQLAVSHASPRSLNDYQRRLEGAIARRDKIQSKQMSSSLTATLASEDLFIPSKNSTEISLLNPQFNVPLVSPNGHYSSRISDKGRPSIPHRGVSSPESVIHEPVKGAISMSPSALRASRGNATDSSTMQPRKLVDTTQEEVNTVPVETICVIPLPPADSNLEMATQIPSPRTMGGYTKRGLVDFTGYMDQRSNKAIADGGFATVYTGQYKNDRIAIKVLRITQTNAEKVQRRLSREILIWSQLEHPNITPLLGTALCSELSNLHAIITPWYENGSSTVYLSKNELTPLERLKLASGVAEGLKYLHQSTPTIVHADLKPNNILIDDQGQPRICDFGLSQVILEEAGSGLTTSTPHTGSLRYVAYEIAFPEEDETAAFTPTTASDIFSLGCVIYEFFIKLLPYSQYSTPLQLLMALMASELPATRPMTFSNLTDSECRLWGLLHECWSMQPEERPRSDEVCSRLQDMICSYDG
ncbi:kinase-like protein [Serendipita vermifera]|nr:kinase-like protein [Serendipita vermifera]